MTTLERSSAAGRPRRAAPAQVGRGDDERRSSLDDVGPICEARRMKGQQKPKQLAKKAPQKTLKEQRAAKKAKKKDY
jgi:hypothetical protein